MNEDIIKGSWKQITGEAKRQWGKLTDNDLLQVEGDAEKLAGKVQEHYGVTKEEAAQQVAAWKAKIAKTHEEAK